MAGFAGLAVLDAAFVGDGVKHLADQRHVEGGGHRDGHREHGRDTVACYAVQRLVPPVVGGNAELLDGRRGMHHQLGLLPDGQLRHQFGCPLLGRWGGFLIVPAGGKKGKAKGE